MCTGPGVSSSKLVSACSPQPQRGALSRAAGQGQWPLGVTLGCEDFESRGAAVRQPTDSPRREPWDAMRR